MIEMNEHAVTVDELISAAFDILEQAKLGTPIMDEDGQPILCDGEPIFVPDLDSANQAIEIIGRLAGFWIERREVTIHTSDSMLGHIAEVVKLEVIEGGNHGETPAAG